MRTSKPEYRRSPVIRWAVVASLGVGVVGAAATLEYGQASSQGTHHSARSRHDDSPNTSGLTLRVTELGPTPSNGGNAPNVIGRPITISHSESVKIYDDVISLKTPLPGGSVSCRASAVIDELSFSNPDLTAYYDPSDCEGLYYPSGDHFAESEKLALDMSTLPLEG
jgi:hypothetical protein